jgi:penicillin amidase
MRHNGGLGGIAFCLIAASACETGGGDTVGATRARSEVEADLGMDVSPRPADAGPTPDAGETTGDAGLGPSAPVRIVRDTHGVPHIYAQTDTDLFFAYGYQLASDRMLQLEMWRRFAFGRRSEVLGAEAPGAFGATTLQDDELVRMFNLPKYGRLDAALMRREDPEHWALLQAWRLGINRRVEEIRAGRAPLPFGFGPDALDFLPEPWDADDPVIVQKMIQLGLDQTILYEILTTILGQVAPAALDSMQMFLPARPTWQIPPEDRVVRQGVPGGGRTCEPGLPAAAEMLAFGGGWQLPSAPRAGSNSWAVNGRFTENGRPMLAGDPHLMFTLMGNMYALHLNSADAGGTFDVAGFAFTAAPGIFAGQNRDIAWTPTSAFGDVMDLWEVPLDGDVATVGGESISVERRREIIHIRGAGDRELEFLEVPGRGVIFDPLIVGVPLPLAAPGRRVLIGWTGFSARSSKYFLGLNRARNVDEFDTAVAAIPEMSYNWVAIDRGAATYRVSLEVPRRNVPAPGREPWRLMDGADPDALWRPGHLSLDTLPHGRAAERGFIVTANNDPYGFTENGRLDDDPFYYGAYFDPGYRAHRIEEQLGRLTARGGITSADMKALQMDVHSGMADDLLPLLDDAWSRAADSPTTSEIAARPDVVRVHALLTGAWDRRMARDSAGAVAFHAFAHFAAANVLEDDIPSIIYERVLEVAPFYVMKIAILALQGRFPDGRGIVQSGPDELLVRALGQTADFLQQRFGTVEPEGYAYGDLHLSDFDNAFGLGMPLGRVATDGGEDTVNVAHAVFRRDLELLDEWRSNYGPVERMVASFPTPDGPPRIEIDFPLGNVADPASPHFDDTMAAWVTGEAWEMPFTAASVAAAAESETRLMP